MGRKEMSQPWFKWLLDTKAVVVVKDIPGRNYVTVRIDNPKVMAQAQKMVKQAMWDNLKERPIQGYDKLKAHVLDYKKHGGGHTDQPSWEDQL